MKNMRTTFALLLLLAAAGNSARAQLQLVEGKPYRFTGTAAVSPSNVTYQWYRDGQPIAGATDTSYILPDHLAYGTYVGFKRGAVSSVCPGSTVYTNIVSVSFGFRNGNVRWAAYNVDGDQTFASRPDMYTKFYQWNRATAWAAEGTVNGWSSAAITDASWTVNPCPAGWRLPSIGEMMELSNLGSTWRSENAMGNAVAGRFYGHNHASCALPNNMVGCIFLPAGGYRNNSGTLTNQGSVGDHWSTQSAISAIGLYLHFDNSSSNSGGNDKQRGTNIRCVQDVQ